MIKLIIGNIGTGKTSKLLEIALDNFLVKKKNVLYVSHTHEAARYTYQKVMEILIDKFGIQEVKLRINSNKPSLLIECQGVEIKFMGLESYNERGFQYDKYKDCVKLLDNLNLQYLEFDYTSVNGELEKDLNE